jgi:DNA-binding NtrC family response regulator/ligand-binding sensor domain-containing protein
MKRLFILIASLVFLVGLHKNACAEKYPFRSYSVDDGLPASDVEQIMQDRHGYLWFGTSDGACRFDGISFTIYTTDDGLAGNYVDAIIEDREGNLWFGCPRKGVSRFDGENWISYTTENGLIDGIIWGMLEDSKGNLWVNTWGGGVMRFDGADWEAFTTEDGLADNRVRSMLEDSKGNLWFGTHHGGASRFDGEKWITRKFSDYHIVDAILEDSHGNIWLGGISPRLVKIAGELENGDYKVLPGENGLPPGIVLSMLEDSEGNIWLGTDKSGLVRFDGEKWNVYTTENGLPANYIWSMYEDKEGNLWFGSSGGGITRLSGTAFTTFTTADGLPVNSSGPRLEDKEGNLWSRSGHGVSKYDGEKWTTYTNEHGLGGNNVQDILKDSKGNLWFACGAGGLSRFDGKKWTTFTAEDWGGDRDYVEILHLGDRKGNIWFNTDESLWKFDGENWTNFTREEGLTDYVSLVLEDKNGNLWFSTPAGVKKFDGENWSEYTTEGGIFEDRQGNLWFITGNGLTCFDGENWKTYTAEDGLAHSPIWAIYEDTSGALWIGTRGGGIISFDGTGFTNYTTEQGLSSNICELIIEHDGYLYFGTPKGLNRFDGEKFKVYTANDGLASTSVTKGHKGAYGGFFKDSKGNLWFASESGVTRFDPSLDRPNLVPPPVHITRLRILEEDRTVTSGLELGYEENSLRIDYIGICFTSPEQVIYNYKLEGLDKDWLETTEHSMYYPYLPPGEYTFKVRARNRDGIWSEKTAELSFEILPPFWATKWFRGSILAVLVMSLMGVYSARTRHLRERTEQQKNEIAERKQQAEKLRNALDEVESLKSRLQEENIYLQEEIKVYHNFEEIISQNKLLKRVLRKVEQVASTEATVLILGETGTGKELIARAVHSLSPRSERPLVTVNCAALPPNLVESELFGHEKGAFTGAHSRKIGRFELADGGTVFLDEVGELPLELQSKLLRVLQQGEFERLGSTHTIKVDVRVIAASNRNLEKAVQEGRFREDLYYRLNVFPVKVPPLRERKDDIPMLVKHFVSKYAAKAGKKIDKIPQSVIDTLQAYHWPGNVRELENIVERAVIVSRGDQLELSEWLPKAGVSSSKSHTTLEDNEREHIIKALELTGWRVSGEKGAAKILDINPQTLYSKMKRMSIKRDR